jgi:CRISPR system Cascade subunit CasD
MATLLLQCVAPLQSWGTQSEYIVRETGREPSKSGVIGLLCAALGRERTAPVTDLAELKMGVRVDQEGKILRDYHTVFEQKVVSYRYYLSDAMFLVGLEGDIGLLKQLHEALKHPRWSLCLGRKSCPPARPPYLAHGLSDKPLLQALKEYPWLGQNKQRYKAIQSLRLVYDDNENGNEFHRDHPVNFARNQRHFQPRRTLTEFTPPPRLDSQLSYPLVSKEIV